jgi:hypothetical protein
MAVENPKVGDRVSYEDMANPRQEGVVTEVVPVSANGDHWESQYRVAFEASLSKFGDEYGLPARETVSDLRQNGWNRVEPDKADTFLSDHVMFIQVPMPTKREAS